MLCSLLLFLWLNIEWGESSRALELYYPDCHLFLEMEIPLCLKSWVSRPFLKPGAVIFTLNGFWTMVLPHRVHCGKTLGKQFFGLLNWYVFWEETYMVLIIFKPFYVVISEMTFRDFKKEKKKSTPFDPVSIFRYLKSMMAGRGIGTLVLLMWIDC